METENLTLESILSDEQPTEHTETHCPHCGASMKAYKHSLSSGILSGLVKAVIFVQSQNKNEFHLQKDLDLTKNEYANFQKLRFHALVAKAKSKPGYWLITKKGGQFLRGEIHVPSTVTTFRNKIINRSFDLTHINTLRAYLPEFQQNFEYELQTVWH